MKKILILLFFILPITASYGQNKKQKTAPPVMEMASTNGLKTKKRTDQFALGKNSYVVYQCNMAPREIMQQKPSDTLIEYHIHFKNSPSSILQITKFATQNGTISREGSYQIKGDTLISTVHYYDPYHGGTLIVKYAPDKYGFLREAGDEMRSINTDTLSIRYSKTEKMKVPPPARN